MKVCFFFQKAPTTKHASTCSILLLKLLHFQLRVGPKIPKMDLRTIAHRFIRVSTFLVIEVKKNIDNFHNQVKAKNVNGQLDEKTILVDTNMFMFGSEMTYK